MNLLHKHLPPQIFNLKGWICLVDEKKLTDVFSSILKQSDFTVLKLVSHQFPVNGFTGFWLLAESHLAIHTFTQSGWCYLELSSCNAKKTEEFMRLTNNLTYEIEWDNPIQSSQPAQKSVLS